MNQLYFDLKKKKLGRQTNNENSTWVPNRRDGVLITSLCCFPLSRQHGATLKATERLFCLPSWEETPLSLSLLTLMGRWKIRLGSMPLKSKKHMFGSSEADDFCLKCPAAVEWPRTAWNLSNSASSHRHERTDQEVEEIEAGWCFCYNVLWKQQDVKFYGVDAND